MINWSFKDICVCVTSSYQQFQILYCTCYWICMFYKHLLHCSFTGCQGQNKLILDLSQKAFLWQHMKCSTLHFWRFPWLISCDVLCRLMGYRIDVFPLKSLISIIKSISKKSAAVEEIWDLVVPGIKGLTKPRCIVYVQLESFYGLHLRKCKTYFLVSCTTQTCAALIKGLCCTLQKSQSFSEASHPKTLHYLTPKGHTATSRKYLLLHTNTAGKIYIRRKS